MVLIDKKTLILYSIIAVLTIALAYCLFSVHNIDGRTEQIGQQLDATAKYQQSASDRLTTIETGLADSQKRVSAIETAIDSASNRIDQSQERLGTSAELISDSKRIIEEVRSRN